MQMWNNWVGDDMRRGRGAGYRLIFCTQYPTNETLPSQVRQNCDGRVCFKLQTNTASRAVLDEDGAEDLPFVRGRSVYKSPHGKIIVQTPLIENKDINTFISPHINLRPRKEKNNAKSSTEGTKTRKHTVIFEET